jgi:hypothetical protein
LSLPYHLQRKGRKKKKRRRKERQGKAEEGRSGKGKEWLNFLCNRASVALFIPMQLQRYFLIIPLFFF